MNQIAADGILPGVRYIASPHCDWRPGAGAVRLLVIHNISLPPGEFGGSGVIDLFTGKLDWDAHPYYQGMRGLRVSAHFYLRRDGELIQFVPTTKRAWHAGASNWQGWERCNDYSIGVELEGTDSVPYTEAQYARLQQLVAALAAAYDGLRLAGHSDIAPGRKTDPGPAFEWHRLQGSAPSRPGGGKK